MFNALLQLLDDGRLTDAQGRTVGFGNTVVIMTSNIGSSDLIEGLGPEGEIAESARTAVMQQLRGHFRPEFLNRLSDVVLFKPLTIEEIKAVVERLVSELGQRLAERRLRLDISAAACEHIARSGFDPVYGARPLKRILEREIETRIARYLIADSIRDDSQIIVDLEEGKLVVRHCDAAAPDLVAA